MGGDNGRLYIPLLSINLSFWSKMHVFSHTLLLIKKNKLIFRPNYIIIYIADVTL